MLNQLHEEGKAIDITTINIFILATFFFGDIQHAIGKYKSIPDYGIKPTGCIAVGRQDLGDHLLGEMKEVAIEPDSRVCERLIILCPPQTTYEDATYSCSCNRL